MWFEAPFHSIKSLLSLAPIGKRPGCLPSVLFTLTDGYYRIIKSFLVSTYDPACILYR